MQRYRHYEPTSDFGESKTGHSWQALDTGHERPVVLKFVAGELSVATRAYLADLADITDARKLPIALPCTVEDGEEGVVIVRGYVDGESVKAISQRKMLSFDEFITLATGVAGAVRSLHHAGLVHGNLTADNIFVTDTGQVWLTDAGLWPEDAVTNLRLSIDRDLPYAAPEVFNGTAPTAASDLYMLGIVFYELLTGRLPFTLDDRDFLIEAIRHDQPNFENDATLHMAGEGRLIIQRLLAKLPEDRAASADELVTTLEATRVFRRGESSLIIDTGSRWSARQYVMVAGVVAILVLYWVIYSQFVK